MEGIARVMSRIAEIEAGLQRLGSAPFPLSPREAENAGFSFASLLSGAGASRGKAVVDEAMRYLGVPYVYGGGGPNGFDCSGLVQYVFRKFGVNLTHYTVTQAQAGRPVSRAELRPGDVIFFGENGGSGFLYHVGIYVGDNSFIHAPHTGDVVKISRLEGKYDANYACARRYI